jgi:hypothetical protein
MVHPFISLLPESVGYSTLIALVVAASVGGVLWLIGSAISRFTTTLLTVALGAAIGMQLPRWFGWNISGAGPAVGGAVLLGVTGFAVHAGWMGILFGLASSIWSAFVVYIYTNNGQPLAWPPMYEGATIVTYAQDLWRSLPPQMSKFLPYTTAACLISGLALAILWTRLTMVLAWSLTGATLAIGCAIAAIQLGRPQLLVGRVPSPTAQVGLFAAIVLLGAAIQWKLAPNRGEVVRSDPRQEQPTEEEMRLILHDPNRV